MQVLGVIVCIFIDCFTLETCAKILYAASLMKKYNLRLRHLHSSSFNL